MRTIRQTIEGMPLVFEPGAAVGLEATIQFHITGDELGDYELRIADGACTFGEGVASEPSLSITTPAHVWGRISRGEISGRDALLEGLYDVSGDAGLLVRMNELFARAPEEAARSEASRRRPGPIALTGGRWLTVAFVPWLMLWLGPLFGLGPVDGIRVACVAAVVLAAYHARFGRMTWFERGSMLVLGAGAFASLAPAGSQALASWGSLVDMAALGIIWLSSLFLASSPLTADYSRWDHAEALAGNSTFLHVNRVLTFLWGAVFVTMAGLSVAVLRWPDAGSSLSVTRWLLLVPTIAATVTLPRRAARLRIEDPEGWTRHLRAAALAGSLLAVAVVVTAAVLAGPALG